MYQELWGTFCKETGSNIVLNKIFISNRPGNIKKKSKKNPPFYLFILNIKQTFFSLATVNSTGQITKTPYNAKNCHKIH